MNVGWTPMRMAILLACVAPFAFFENRFVMPRTPSIPYKLLYREGGPGNKGDYVNFEVPGSYIDRPETTVRLTKKVACVGGEILTFVNGAHYCAGQLLDRVLDRNGRGEPLAAFRWNGEVPAGKAFVVGTHPRSFDSRYFGFIDVSTTERLRPIF